MRRQKLHWMVVPIGSNTGLYTVKSQYDDVIRERTPDGLFSYSIVTRVEDIAEIIAKKLNEGILTVNFNDRNVLEV
jgi:hypothetical protein